MYFLRRLFLWWINKGSGSDLRGRECAKDEVSYIEEVLLKMSKEPGDDGFIDTNEYMILERDHSTGQGIQRIYKFLNGYGASVVRHSFSYTTGNNEWEVAVIKYNSDNPDDWSLDYETPITDEVIGHVQDGKELNILLKRISNLKETK